MSTKIYSSPTGNIFELLKQQEEEQAIKQQAKDASQLKPSGASKMLTPAERAKKQKEKDALKKQQEDEQRKAALQELLEKESMELAIAEGFTQVQSQATVRNNNKLSRLEWEAKKASGELEDKKEGTQLPQKKGQGQPTSSQYKNQSTGGSGSGSGSGAPKSSNYQGNKGGNNNYNNSGSNDNQAWNKGNNNKTKPHNTETEPTGRGPKPGRELDRHSQSITSRKPQNKRNGDGKGNWGNEVKSGKPDEWDVPTKKDVKTKESVESTQTQTEEKTETTTEGEKKPETTPVVQQPKIDPDDEGYGKKTFLEYQKEEADKLASLQKKLEEAQVKPQSSQKKAEQVDMSKFSFIEAEKEDIKLTLKGVKVEASGHAKTKEWVFKTSSN